MKEIKPTKNEVFDSLRALGCCWLGGTKCYCYSHQMKRCFIDEEKKMVKVELTDEEIAKSRERNEKAMEELYTALDEIFGG